MKVSTTAKDNGDPSTPRTVASLEDEEEEVMPWEEYDFIPTTASGKQKTPNMIRNELQRYIDTSGRTQKDILEEMGVNSNSFRRFMNPKTYKNSWSAIENSTYMAAGRLLARVKHEEKENKKKAKKQTAATKRKAKDDAAATPLPPAEKKVKTSGSNKSASEKRAEAEEWMRRVVETSAPGADIIYDSCPQVVKKIKDCLYKNKGVTKASFCRIALEGTNNNSLARFLAGKKQDQQGCIVYKLAYCFFEKLRIMEGKPKSKERLKNEQEQGPDGFSTKSPTGKPSYFIVPAFW